MAELKLLITAIKGLLSLVAKTAFKVGTKYVAASLRHRIAADLSPEELDAKLDKLFGDGFAQQLLDIQGYVDRVLAEVQTQIQFDVLRQSILAEYRNTEQRIVETWCRLSLWLEDPQCDSKQQDFIRVYQRNDPFGAITWLHHRLVSSSNESLMRNIVKVCGDDWMQIVAWKQNICLLLSHACGLELAYRWIEHENQPHQAQPAKGERIQID